MLVLLLVWRRLNVIDANMPVSDLALRSAKPRERPFKLSDGGGLHLLVQPTSGKLWRMAYRFDGKQKTLAFGSYPAVSLAEARIRRDAAKKLLASGTDPSIQKKIDRRDARASATNTFKTVGEEWLAKKVVGERAAPATVSKHVWLLGMAYEGIGERPISDIKAVELLDVLRPIEVRGYLETARRLRALLSRVFRYAVVTGRAERDPAADLQGALTAPTVTHRSAILDPAGVGQLLRAIRSYDGQPTTAAALRLAPLVFVRPGELRHARWAEFDLHRATWRLPAARMKMRLDHIVPLARQAVEIIRELKPVSGHAELLFPSLRALSRPISENTLNAALRRLGYAKDEMVAHGFRRIASTLLNELGWNSDWIERQLAHVERSGVRGAYNAAQWLADRKRMMQSWADYLDELAGASQI